MSKVVVIDDRPFSHPDVVRKRNEAWNRLSREEQEEIDSKVAETVARVMAKRQQKIKSEE